MIGRPSPERLAEIREFADRDILDLVEPDEMYYFLDLLEQFESLQWAAIRLCNAHRWSYGGPETLIALANQVAGP